MLTDSNLGLPTTHPDTPNEAIAPTYTLREMTGQKTVRVLTNSNTSGTGTKDLLTVSHSEDAKTGRRRSLLRIDLDYKPTGATSPTGAAAYLVLDFNPSISGGVGTSVHIQRTVDRLLSIFGVGVVNVSSAVGDPDSNWNRFLRGEP